MGNSVLAELGGPRARHEDVSLPRGRHRLHAMPTTMGYEIRRDSSYEWNGRLRGNTPFTVLQHTIAGAGNLQYERRRYRLQGGRHDARHRAAQSSLLGRGRRKLGVLLAVDERRGGRPHPPGDPGDHRAGPAPEAETIEHIARCCLRLIEGEGETAGAASAIAYEAATALYDDVFSSPAADSEDNEFASIHVVIEYIRANLDKELSVDELAEVAGFSRAHFSRLFWRRPEPTRRLRAAGAHAARRAAAHRPHSPATKEIAAMTGFDDPNYFAKVFRRFFGTSPTGFRESRTDTSGMTITGSRDSN